MILERKKLNSNNDVTLNNVLNLKEEILMNFKYLMSLKKYGKNLFFPDIDKIKRIMLNELYNNNN